MMISNNNQIYQQTHNCIGNIKREGTDAIRQAARETGFPIEICVATSGKPDYISIWTRDLYRDHGPFWKRYEELISEKE